jgi:hypothetical protein
VTIVRAVVVDIDATGPCAIALPSPFVDNPARVFAIATTTGDQR